MKITVKKPTWSTWVVGLDGKGSVIHNYADGTNSGPLPIDRSGVHPNFSGSYLRRLRHPETDPLAKFVEEINGDVSQDSDSL